MDRTNAWLDEFRSDVYSQGGEDGVIRKVLDTLPLKDKWCVEFGAWDGRYLSNTANLIENHGYNAVLIEGSREKFVDLKNNYSRNPRVVPMNRFVGFGEHDNLDGILEKTAIPRDFDFLSIDIDGNDYHVWKAMSRYAPKLVCIEFNPTIPTEVRFVQPADPLVNQGAGLLPLVELGKSKGYELISVSQINAFFVLSDYFPLFRIEDNSPHVLRTSIENVAHVFFGYDGTVFLRGNPKSPWHDMAIRESRIQILPRCLRKYPHNYNIVEKRVFQAYRKVKKLVI